MGWFFDFRHKYQSLHLIIPFKFDSHVHYVGINKHKYKLSIKTEQE